MCEFSFWDRVSWNSSRLQMHFAAEDNFELLILLSLPLKFWDCKHMLFNEQEGHLVRLSLTPTKMWPWKFKSLQALSCAVNAERDWLSSPVMFLGSVRDQKLIWSNSWKIAKYNWYIMWLFIMSENEKNGHSKNKNDLGQDIHHNFILGGKPLGELQLFWKHEY